MATKKNSEKTTIQITTKLRDYLLDRATKRDDYEDVIWRLIGQKQISEADKDELPPEYVPKLNSGKRKR